MRRSVKHEKVHEEGALAPAWVRCGTPACGLPSGSVTREATVRGYDP